MPTTMTFADLEIVDTETNEPMQTIAYLEKPYSLKLTKAKIPEPDPDEIRVKVMYVGICGSDLEAFRGTRKPEFISFPARLGHEVAGIIDTVGEKVQGLKPGMKVACRYVWGAYAQYITCKPFNVQVMPDSFDLQSISLIEILPGVIHTAELAEINSGTTVLIMGQGVSGLMLTQVLSLYSPAELVVTDLKDRNLELATHYGATKTFRLPSAETQTAEFLKDAYPHGFDVVIPCLLEGDCVMDAVNCTRIGGKVVMYGGIGTAKDEFDFFKVHRRRATIISTEPRRDIDMYRYFKEGVSLVTDGLIQTREYIDQVYPLEDIQKAFEERMDHTNDVIHVLINTQSEEENA
jgi:threonine dehydrogenase-like Zn-dependent dehydrogenase